MRTSGRTDAAAPPGSAGPGPSWSPTRAAVLLGILWGLASMGTSATSVVVAPLAQDLGLDPDWLAGPEGLDLLSGRTIVPGSEPIAQAYAGHQFGHFVPQLGDGREHVLVAAVGEQHAGIE